MKYIFISCAILVIFAGCYTAPEHEGLTIDDFNFLEEGMSYEEIELALGKPGEDIGSGLWIIVYDLGDGSSIHLQFFSPDYLEMAALVYSDGTYEILVP